MRNEISMVSRAKKCYERSTFEDEMKQRIFTERVSGDIYDAIAANDQAHPQ